MWTRCNLVSASLRWCASIGLNRIPVALGSTLVYSGLKSGSYQDWLDSQKKLPIWLQSYILSPPVEKKYPPVLASHLGLEELPQWKFRSWSWWKHRNLQLEECGAVVALSTIPWGFPLNHESPMIWIRCVAAHHSPRCITASYCITVIYCYLYIVILHGMGWHLIKFDQSRDLTCRFLRHPETSRWSGCPCDSGHTCHVRLEHGPSGDIDMEHGWTCPSIQQIYVVKMIEVIILYGWIEPKPMLIREKYIHKQENQIIIK